MCTVVTSRGRERQVELFKQLSQSNGLVPTAGDLDSGAEQIFSEGQRLEILVIKFVPCLLDALTLPEEVVCKVAQTKHA